MKKFVSNLIDGIVKNPLLSLCISSVILIVSVYFTFQLGLNSDQIDLLPPKIPSVVQTKKVIEMIGGNGFFTIVLKFKDEKGMGEELKQAFQAKREQNDQILYLTHLKAAHDLKDKYKDYYKEKEILLKKSADTIYQRLMREPEIRFISYKYGVDFVTDRFGLFVQTDDLQKIQERIKKKIDQEVERKNPFYIDLGQNQYQPKFDDIIGRYQKLAKRDIFESYTISSDKGMLLLYVKPKNSFSNIIETRELEQKIKKILTEELQLEKKGVIIGYTGAYKSVLDDYQDAVDALKPVTIAGFLAISILLLIFLRNPFFILMLLISLVTGVFITFGITYFIFPKLNTVTSVAASVLAGAGVDYGILFLFRFREELTKKNDVLHAIKESFFNTGAASFYSTITTMAAFVTLIFSEFRGFSEFGLIAFYGLLIIGVSMYVFSAIQVAIIFKYFPKLSKIFYLKTLNEESYKFVEKIFVKPKLVLTICFSIVLGFAVFAPKIEFNYSGRDLLPKDRESLVLTDEIGDRFDLTSDPQVIIADTLEQSEAAHDYFTPVPDSIKEDVDQVVSLWTFAPSYQQQIENRKILDKIKKDIRPFDPSYVDEKYRKYIPGAKKLLEAKPFHYTEIPVHISSQFKELPSSKMKGYMVFIYPKIALWNGKDLMKFHDAIAHVEYPKIPKKVLNSILYREAKGKMKNFTPYKSKFSESEKSIILKGLNSYSKADLLAIDVLPGTADIILKNRPFSSFEKMRELTYSSDTAGSLILFAKLSNIVQTEGFMAFGFTIIIVIIMLIVGFRNVKAAILSLTPLVFGVGTLLGFMYLIDEKLNYMNVLVFPILIGYGINNGIYIFYRFKEENNLVKAMQNVAPPIISSTLTTLAGWASLLITSHRGLWSVGLTASIGMAASLFIGMTILPSLIAMVFKDKDISISEHEKNESSKKKNASDVEWIHENIKINEENDVDNSKIKNKLTKKKTAPKKKKSPVKKKKK